MSQRCAETEPLYWPDDRIAAHQWDCLRQTFLRAARSPFYRSRLHALQIESLHDLTRVPLTSKEDVRAASPFGLLAVEPTEVFQYHESFGTTGVPASSWLTRGDFQNLATQINHSAVDLRPEDRVLVRFPYAISMPAHIVTQAAHQRGACVIPASSRTAVSPYPRVIELLRKLQVTVLACMPTEAIWLAEAARLMGFDTRREFASLRAICTAGELLSDARRDRIAALWKARVYNLYGCTEAGNIAADCEAGRLHLSWDHFVLEVLHEQTRQPVSAGETGFGVLTTLSREAMPLLRFELGDYLRLEPRHTCPCGRSAPVLDLFGRDLNTFRFGGRRFFVREFEERLLNTPVGAFGNLFLFEVHPHGVRCRVEAERPDRSLYRTLENQIRQELDLPFSIESLSPGGLLDRSRLLRIEPVNKPRIVAYVEDGQPGQFNLDTTMNPSLNPS